ncbi:hypothetical protein CEXT_629581 [Caerostris extrusa]|nr:hypothetical protein CEXT_629581 [Caerostris extrusa]
MEKKWKVAQQLSVDLAATPSEILGFRDPCYLPPVSQSQTLGPSPPPPFHNMRPRSSSQSRQRKSYEDSATPKKRPPPPPPKRSETTQLSNR